VDSLSALIEAACAVLRCKLATDSTYDALSWVGPVEDPRRSWIGTPMVYWGGP